MQAFEEDCDQCRLENGYVRFRRWLLFIWVIWDLNRNCIFPLNIFVKIFLLRCKMSTVSLFSTCAYLFSTRTRRSLVSDLVNKLNIFDVWFLWRRVVNINHSNRWQRGESNLFTIYSLTIYHLNLQIITTYSSQVKYNNICWSRNLKEITSVFYSDPIIVRTFKHPYPVVQSFVIENSQSKKKGA